MSQEQKFITDHATGKEVPLIRIKLNSSNLEKPHTDKTPSNKIPRTEKLTPVVNEKPGLKDKEALRVIEEYKRINEIFEKIDNGKKMSRLSLFFLKRKLHSLVAKEYNLWRSIPLSKNAARGVDVVSSRVQRELEKVSSKISSQLTMLQGYNLLPRGFDRGIYRLKQYKVPKKQKSVRRVR